MLSIDVPAISVQSDIYEVIDDLRNKRRRSEEVFIHLDNERRVTLDHSDFSKDDNSNTIDLCNNCVIFAPALYKFEKPKPGYKVTCGDCYGNDRQLAFGTSDGNILYLTIDAATEKVKCQNLETHILHTNQVKFVPPNNSSDINVQTARYLISSGMDYEMRFHDLNSGKIVCAAKNIKGMVSDIVFTSPSEFYTLCERNGVVQSWSFDDGICEEYPFEMSVLGLHEDDKIQTIAFSEVHGLIYGTLKGLFVNNKLVFEHGNITQISLGPNGSIGLRSDNSVILISSCFEPKAQFTFQQSVSQIILKTDRKLYVRTESTVYDITIDNGEQSAAIAVLSADCEFMTSEGKALFTLGKTIRVFN
ncbi:hypothetical protein DASB73_037320 [Starmerella bacillaris]|uniref:Uncharacterized protein n=1 Tax=Starmerella bacillaris TaxID=1247836 RepID=A0AAV5RMM8_STABA|nr:hypothetical protein DASB73_037320 [Starmerella bacillaris]